MAQSTVLDILTIMMTTRIANGASLLLLEIKCFSTLQYLRWKMIQSVAMTSVELFNGLDNSSSRLSKSCGSRLPLPVYSSSRYMYIRFKSDSSVTQKGFVAHYRKLTDSSGAYFG